MQPFDRPWQPFVVARRAAAARRPGEGALDDPPPGEQHEAALDLQELDDLRPDAVRGGGRIRLLPGGDPVHEGHHHAVARDRLRRHHQLGHPRPVLLLPRG